MNQSPSPDKYPESVVVTIDGPAGAGKSTVARQLAERLEFEFLDTGAMYRCATLAVLRAKISLRDQDAVATLTSSLHLDLQPERVLLNGEDVSQAIRTPEVSAAIGVVADNVAVRQLLSAWQRDVARGKRILTEGRDQGTEVFQDAPCKIFLFASREERAKRRLEELLQRGIHIDFDSVLDQQNQRDHEDQSRPVGGLRRAHDAIDFCTDGMDLPAVVDQLVMVIDRCLLTAAKRETSQ